jgi:iron complex outermembrane recepter protein
VRAPLALVCLLAMSVLFTGLPQRVAAEEQRNAQMEEIVVTARKREERLQDLPGSAAAITESMIEDLGGIYSLRDVTDLIPGITLVEAASSDLMEPSIRGAGQSRNRSSVSATGFYRNGAYFASQSLGGRSLARMDTYDAQQIEVLRGPQGALYGRNALGGAMNVISKRPDSELDFKLGVRAGELDYQGYEVIANIPLGENFAARVSYFTEERDDGFFEDQAGNPVDVTEFEHIRLGLLWNPTDQMEIYYSFDQSEERFFPGIRQRFRATQTDLRQTLINTPHIGDHDIDNHALTIDYTFAKGIFSAVTNLREREVYRLEDGDFFLANANAAAVQTQQPETFVDADIFFQELRWTSTLGGAFEYLIGADYYSMTTSELIDNFSAGGQTVATSTIRDWETDNKSWAVYASVDYDFANMPLSITAEIRYAKDKVDGEILTITPKSLPLVRLDLEADNDFTNTPWGLTASWRFENVSGALSEAMAYAKVGSSYRHGGLNLGSGLPTDAFPTQAIYDEEDSITYEIGTKTSWLDGALRLNAAVFFNTYQDFLDTTTNGCPELCPFLDPVTVESLGFDADGNRIEVTPGGDPGLQSPTAFFIGNVGELESWGYEIETMFRFNLNDAGGRLLGSVGYSKQMGEVTEIGSGVNPSQADELGARLNFVRPTELKGNLTWRQPLPGFDGVTMLAAATYIHESGGFAGLNTSGLKIDGVDRLDLRLGLESQHWSATLNGNNVLDKEYFTDRSAVRFRLNDPEYYFLELSYRFR